MAKRRQLGVPRLASEPRPRRKIASSSEAFIRGRSLFNRAIRFGYTSKEASYFANNGIDPPPRRTDPGAVQPAVDQSPNPPEMQTVTGNPGQTVVGGGDQQPEVKFDPDQVPATWRDLGWPDLRDLAATAMAGRKPQSRRQAIQAIEDALEAVEKAKAANTGDST